MVTERFNYVGDIGKKEKVTEVSFTRRPKQKSYLQNKEVVPSEIIDIPISTPKPVAKTETAIFATESERPEENKHTIDSEIHSLRKDFKERAIFPSVYYEKIKPLRKMARAMNKAGYNQRRR